MRHALFLFPALALSGAANAQTIAPATFNGGHVSNPTTFGSGLTAPPLFYAQAYGSCTWNATSDVSPCIQAAISAATAAGGGTVMLPAGKYGVASTITQSASGVSLAGAGTGIPRDNVNNSSYLSVTTLTWIGAAGGTVFDEEPTGSQTTTISEYAASVTGIVFDCASLANVCAKFASVNYSVINIGVSEPRMIGAYLTTQVINDSPGMQRNDITIDSRATNASYSPTGILIDGGAGSNWNVSYNTSIRRLFAWTYNGDGIVFGDEDNNVIGELSAYTQPGGTGRQVVFASSGYTMPNGMSVTTHAADTVVSGKTGANVTVQGYQTGAVVTPNAGNTGSATFATITPSGGTVGSVGKAGGTLTFASATGVAAGEMVNCGGTSSGVATNDSVNNATSTTATLYWPTINTVSAGTLCSFSWGFTATAVPGTYTITAVNATTFNISAPTNGHSQSNVTLSSSGVLSFTDVVIPISGTAAAGDSWTIATGSGAQNISILNIDSANSVPEPIWEWGSTGQFQHTSDEYPSKVASNWSIILQAYPFACIATGPNSVCIGASNAATGQYSSVVGGIGATASGFGAFAQGHQTAAQGPYSYTAGEYTIANGNESAATGENSWALGNYSRSAGNNGSDRDRVAADCYGTATFSSVRGSVQKCFTILSASMTGTATRLTGDQNAAGATNVFNIPTAGLHYHLSLSASCKDSSGTGNVWASWDLAYGDLDLGSSLTYTGAYSTATAPTRSNGTPTGGGAMSTATLTVAADGTNNGLSVIITPPSGTTDTLHCAAPITSLVEVQ